MGRLRFSVFALVALVLTACAAPRQMPIQEVRTFNIQEVVAVAAPDAAISWGEGDYAYIRQIGADPNDPASGGKAQTPEGRAAVGRLAAEKLAGHMRAALQASLRGPRPVKVSVTLRGAFIPSAVQRIIIGGHPTLTADVAILDAKTGAVLLSYDKVTSQSFAGQGIGGTLVDAAISGGQDHFDRVAANYSASFARWLLAE